MKRLSGGIVFIAVIVCLIWCGTAAGAGNLPLDVPSANETTFAELRDFYVIGSFSSPLSHPGDIIIELFRGDTATGTPVRVIRSSVNESGVTPASAIDMDYAHGTGYGYGLMMVPDLVTEPGGILNVSNKVVVTNTYYAGVFFGGATQYFDLNYTWPDGTPLQDLTAGNYTIRVTGTSGGLAGRSATKQVTFGLTHASLGRYSPPATLEKLTAFSEAHGYRIYLDPFPGYFIPPDHPEKLYEIPERWVPNNAIEVVNGLWETVIDRVDTAENDLLVYNIRNTSATNNIEAVTIVMYNLTESSRTVFHYYDIGEPSINYVSMADGSEKDLDGTIVDFPPGDRLTLTRAEILHYDGITRENLYNVRDSTPKDIDLFPTDGVRLVPGQEFILYGAVRPIPSSVSPVFVPYPGHDRIFSFRYIPDNRIASIRYTISDFGGHVVNTSVHQVHLDRRYDPASPSVAPSEYEFGNEFVWEVPGTYRMDLEGLDLYGDVVAGTGERFTVTVVPAWLEWFTRFRDRPNFFFAGTEVTGISLTIPESGPV